QHNETPNGAPLVFPFSRVFFLVAFNQAAAESSRRQLRPHSLFAGHHTPPKLVSFRICTYNPENEEVSREFLDVPRQLPQVELRSLARRSQGCEVRASSCSWTPARYSGALK